MECEKSKRKEDEKERDPGRCALFIQKRGRYCRLAVAKGSKYCGEHLNFDPEFGVSSTTPQRRRIPCPLDPHHTVYQHQLELHLKKCNAAKKGTPVYFTANINTGIPGYHPSDEEKRPLSAFPQSQLDRVIAKVEKIYKEHSLHIEEVVLKHAALTSDLSDPNNGVTALKHIRQQASILGHLEKLQLLQPHTCFIEFGAGRGKLTNCLQRACLHDETIQYLLVDRASCRRKKDVYRRGDPSSESRVQRLLVDIEHLDLGRVECLQREEVKGVVAISKHLCGAATDLTLRCLLETMSKSHIIDQQPMGLQKSSDVKLLHQSNPTEPPHAKRACTDSTSLSHKLKAIVIALCCHHRCCWSQLVGTEWLSSCGFSPIDIHLITKMTSWAVCGVRGPAKGDVESCDIDHEHSPYISKDTASSTDDTVMATDSTHMTTNSTHSYPVTSSTSSLSTNSTSSLNNMATGPTHSHNTVTTSSTHSLNTMATTSAAPHPPSYHPHPRETTGILCKRFLDLARLHYLQDRGLDARLVYFVSRDTSLENVLLIGTPPVLKHDGNGV